MAVVKYGPVDKGKLYFRILIPIAICQGVASCNHAPSQNILGSFFPSWMYCAALGIISTLVVRLITVRSGIDIFVPAKLVIYSGLAIALTFIFWLLWFGH